MNTNFFIKLIIRFCKGNFVIYMIYKKKTNKDDKKICRPNNQGILMSLYKRNANDITSIYLLPTKKILVS